MAMTEAQREALTSICERYKVSFDEDDYKPAFDLPDGYVAGWVGGNSHGFVWSDDPVAGSLTSRGPNTTIYVGCDPEGRISS
jgi:hypothetical protein